VKRFAFDLELLVNLHRSGARIVEAPVVVTRARALPRIGVGDVRDVMTDTAAIWYRTYVRRWYDRAAQDADRWLELSPPFVTADLEAVQAPPEDARYHAHSRATPSSSPTDGS
jgi:hypothetical protein